MKFVLPIGILALSVTSCMSLRTEYAPQGHDGGYSDSKIDENIFTSKFKGNIHTTESETSLFSKLRAIEVCKQNNYKYTVFINTTNSSVEKNVMRSKTEITNPPKYTYGTSKENSSKTTTYSYNTYQNSQEKTTAVWNDTYQISTSETIFSCANTVKAIGLKLKTISINDLNTQYKDGMGAVQVVNFLSNSPNKDIFRTGDIILKIDGNRIQDNLQFQAILNHSDKNSSEALILRDGKEQNVTAEIYDNSHNVIREMTEVISTSCLESDIKDRKICKE